MGSKLAVVNKIKDSIDNRLNLKDYLETTENNKFMTIIDKVKDKLWKVFYQGEERLLFEGNTYYALQAKGDYKIGTSNSFERYFKKDIYSLGTITSSNTPKLAVRLYDNCLEFRSLTTLECYRLMGFTDFQHDKVKHLSKSILYHTAGNSMVVSVMKAIAHELIKE